MANRIDPPAPLPRVPLSATADPAAEPPPEPATEAPVRAADAADTPVFPCSVAQERFWLLDRLDPGNAALNVAFRWQLRGHVDARRLETAFRQIIERHEVLRTVFREVDGRPVQQVQARSPFRLAEIDLGGVAEAARDAEAERIAIIEARAPFDLAEGPLIRATLLRLQPDTAHLLVTTHQAVADGWSMGVIARELGTLYRALADDTPSPLAELPLQYGDYSEWQLAWIAESGHAAEEAYWSRQLAGLKPFKVPPDRPQQTVPGNQGAVATLMLPTDLTRRAQALGGAHGATLFATALAALATTLHRYTAETEIVIGMLVSERDQVELEGMVGQFVNALILRNDLSGDPSFGALIERLRDTSTTAIEHRRIPIERLLSMVGGARGDGQPALISVNFIFQRSFIEPADYGDFQLSDLPPLPSDTMYDLNFFMVEEPHGWQLACQYSSEQYERDTVERLLRYMVTILDHGCRDPALPLSAIPMLSGDERQRMQGDGPDQQAFPALRGLGARFAGQVVERPSAIAVSCGERVLSYAELDELSGRLAGYLQARGIGAGTRVGLCLPRGLDGPLAILALLRLGASWIAIDPTESRSRIGLVIEAARLSVVLCGTHLAELLPGVALTRLELDRDADAIARATPPPAVVTTPDSEACAFAHPSAPGRLALVRLSHAALETGLLALVARPGFGAGDTVVATSSCTLEAWLIELLLPLLVGGHVDIADDIDSADPALLLRRIAQQRNPVLVATPRLLGRLVAAGWPVGSRVRVWCHGERPNVSLARRLIARSAEVWTLYTAPGAGICPALHRLEKAEDAALLGRSTPGTQLRVLGPGHLLLPIGAVGELHVGGVPLMLGTASAPALADRLIAAPDVGAAGSHLLRTGDLARVRVDGLLEYMGRNDRALRIDGHWVELAEIETQLTRHPNVAEAAVDAAADAEDVDGAPLLTAWIVLAGTTEEPGEALIARLRQHYAQRLSSYQLPGRYLFVDSLPRNARQEVDFRRLRRPAAAAAAGAAPVSFAAELSAIENRIARIWAELLGRDDIAANDNFFELGGHSLLAARMLRRIESEFTRRVGLAALFRAPTLRELGRLLESEDVRDFDFRQVVKLQPNGTRPPMIAINNTGIYYTLAKRLGQDQPVTSLQLFDPSVSLDSMPKSIEEIATLYVQLIQRVQPQGPYLLMGWCVAGALTFEVARQLQASGQTVANLYLMDAWLPNYLKELSPVRRFVNDRSLRLQHIWNDLKGKWRAGKTLREFLVNRRIYKRLAQLLRRGPAAAVPIDDPLARALPAGYDLWLLDYLMKLSESYEPKPYDGHITLFRSRREPTGLWFDPLAGWGRLARRGVSLHLIDGDHFSMFREPGASQMAARIAETR